MALSGWGNADRAGAGGRGQRSREAGIMPRYVRLTIRRGEQEVTGKGAW